MKEMNSKMLLDLSKKVDEVGKLLKKYFEEQNKKEEENVLGKFTHEQKMAYLKGKGVGLDAGRKYL